MRAGRRKSGDCQDERVVENRQISYRPTAELATLPRSFNEGWLFKHPKALESVLRGMAQAKEGKLRRRD